MPLNPDSRSLTACPILLIGGDGHCRSSIDAIEQEGKYQISGIVDMPEKRGQSVLGTDENLPDLLKSCPNVLITLGQIKLPATNYKTFIIAEAGVNHNGSLDIALQMVDVAAATGADAVKFQNRLIWTASICWFVWD